MITGSDRSFSKKLTCFTSSEAEIQNCGIPLLFILLFFAQGRWKNMWDWNRKIILFKTIIYSSFKNVWGSVNWCSKWNWGSIKKVFFFKIVKLSIVMLSTQQKRAIWNSWNFTNKTVSGIKNQIVKKRVSSFLVLSDICSTSYVESNDWRTICFGFRYVFSEHFQKKLGYVESLTACLQDGITGKTTEVTLSWKWLNRN